MIVEEVTRRESYLCGRFSCLKKLIMVRYGAINYLVHFFLPPDICKTSQNRLLNIHKDVDWETDNDH